MWLVERGNDSHDDIVSEGKNIIILSRLEYIVVHSLPTIQHGLSRPSPTAYFPVWHQTKVMTAYDLHSSYDARPGACSVRRICRTKVCGEHESAALGSD